MKNDYALITGASSGIGLESARYIAGKGINLILTARREDILANISSEISEKYNVHVDIRNENDMNYKIKPGTKTVVASAFNSIIITTKHPGAYELLGPKYPYYCECNYKSIQNTIEFLKKTFA